MYNPCNVVVLMEDLVLEKRIGSFYLCADFLMKIIS